MHGKKPFDVIVIGSGISGLSSLYHLTRMGVKRLAIASKGQDISQSLRASGGLFGRPSDNYTRWCHSHGSMVARSYWKWNSDAFEALLQFAETRGLPVQRGRRIRVVTTDHEWKEAQEAVLLLQRDGFAAELRTTEAEGLPPTLPGIQSEGLEGAFIDPHLLIRTLESEVSQIPKLPGVTRIKHGRETLQVECEDGSSEYAEIIVINAHFGTSRLLPALGPALIPVADQWSAVEVPPKFFPPSWAPGTVITLNHGNEWGVLQTRNLVRIGGARYLRPMEGVEAQTPSTHDKIVAHLTKRLSMILGHEICLDDQKLKVISTVGLLDIRPCDELPIVGPLFGEPRILVATGFSAQGPHLGYYAGCNLSELISQGHCPHLPRSLWPERLRSLAM